MLRTICALFVLMPASSALAYTEFFGTISTIRTETASARAFVCFNDADTNAAGCGVSTPKCLGFALNTDQGKASLSLILSAKVSGLNVRGKGKSTATCTVFPGAIEDFDYFYIE